MSRENIKNLDDLLKRHIGGKKIVNVKTSRLTAPGENYGGLLLRLDITLEGKTKDDVHVVAKCIPINVFLQKVFDIQSSVKKEIAFYDTILPLFQEYQREKGVKQVMDFFPRLYGARLNLNGSDVVDENAAIILENLVESGYKNVNRTIGFDLQTIELILKNLAAFHSVPLAFNLSKPDLFAAKIGPYIKELHASSPPPTPDDWFSHLLEDQEDLKPLIPKLSQLLKFHPKKDDERSRPFFTVTHGDMWGNNIMVKFVDGKAVSSQFVDFQNFALRSPTRDLLFLLLTSVEWAILDRHFDALIKFYHDRFIENLVQLGCDTTKFSFDQFQKEMESESRDQLGQIAFMTVFVIFANKGGPSPDDHPDKPPDFGKKEHITPQAKERFVLLIRKYQEKGWL